MHPSLKLFCGLVMAFNLATGIVLMVGLSMDILGEIKFFVGWAAGSLMAFSFVMIMKLIKP